MSLRRPSLTLRLATMFALTSLLLVSGLGLALYLASAQHFAEQDEHELLGRAAAIISHQLSHGGGLPNFLQVDDEPVDAHRTAAEMVDAQGRRHPGRDTDLFTAIARTAQGTVTTTHAGSTWRATELPFPTLSGTPNVRLRVAINIDHHINFLAMLQRALLATGVAVTLLGLGLGWLAARRGLRPLDAIAHRAAEISASQLHARLDDSDLPLELLPLARQLNAMLARLDESFRRLAEFSSDIAHELRTPVSNLMTETEVALSRPRSVDEYRDTLSSNLEEFGRLARMVNDMLFLAKADHGLVIPQSESIELATEVEALFEFYDALAAEREITLHRVGAGAICGDRLMMRRALSNLLANAIAHSPDSATIRVSIEAAAGRVLVSVDNPGEAIPEDAIPRLFDRFYRAETARSHSSDGAGMGLGLAIVRSIVLAHGGSVSASRVEACNRFQIELPGLL